MHKDVHAKQTTWLFRSIEWYCLEIDWSVQHYHYAILNTYPTSPGLQQVGCEVLAALALAAEDHHHTGRARWRPTKKLRYVLLNNRIEMRKRKKNSWCQYDWLSWLLLLMTKKITRYIYSVANESLTHQIGWRINSIPSTCIHSSITPSTWNTAATVRWATSSNVRSIEIKILKSLELFLNWRSVVHACMFMR